MEMGKLFLENIFNRLDFRNLKNFHIMGMEKIEFQWFTSKIS
jgi:hypothetical protein